MDEKLAADIYWVLCKKVDFFAYVRPFNEEYHRLLEEREKIANRYEELKSTNSPHESEKIAKIEWLMNCDKQNEDIK